MRPDPKAPFGGAHLPKAQKSSKFPVTQNLRGGACASLRSERTTDQHESDQLRPVLDLPTDPTHSPLGGRPRYTQIENVALAQVHA